MWEFFLGVSLACFFAAYWIGRDRKPKPRQREAVYAPRGEVLHYKTRKKEADYVVSEPFEEAKPAAVPQNTAYGGASYNTGAAKPFEPAKDDFVEYAASVVTDENTESAPKNAAFDDGTSKNASEDDENDEKKQKFSALRFFNS